MTIDPDLLRATLQRHAGDVSPAFDVPFEGIERKARGLRRRRQALSAGGTVAVVAALAIAIPLSSGSHAVKVRPPQAGIGPSPVVPVVAGPPNVLTWPSQGTVVPSILAEASQAYAQSRSRTTAPEVKVLDAEPDGILTQMWFPGDAEAATVGWSHPDSQLELKPALTSATIVVGLYIGINDPASAGPPEEKLIVVTTPTAGPVSYSVDGTSFTPVESAHPHAVLIHRDARLMHDAIKVPLSATATYSASVTSLLCGIDGCG